MLCIGVLCEAWRHLEPGTLVTGNPKMRFEEIYTDWREKCLTQAEAGRLLGVCEGRFRWQIERMRPTGWMD
jgi:hypothetical protein